MTRFSDRMERIREDLIRRAHMNRSDAMERGEADLDGQVPNAQTEEPSQNERSYTNRLVAMLSGPRELFHRSTPTNGADVHRAESPKTPDSEGPAMQSRLQPGTESEISNQTSSMTAPAPVARSDRPVSNPPSQTSEHQTTTGQDSHRSRRRGLVKKTADKARKRFLFCFPWIQSGQVRVAALHCFTSGLFVLLLVAVCKWLRYLRAACNLTNKASKLDLALVLTQRVATNELTILLLIIILISTLFFCYNIVRLCLRVMRPDKYGRPENSRRPAAMNPADLLKTGYAMPRRPIRVVLAQDEEVIGREDEVNRMTPPAYGFWRESVVCSCSKTDFPTARFTNNHKRLDPNRLYWQRNEAAVREAPVPEQESEHDTSTTTSNVKRPPSYSSEDGVSYVIDAMAASGSSTVSRPRAEESERGRAR